MKILQYSHDVAAGLGGARRVFCDMANALVARGHEIYAVCNHFRSNRPFYPLDDRVRFINLNSSGRREIKLMTWIAGIRPFLPSVCEEMLERTLEEPLRRRKGEPLVQLIREIQPDIVVIYWIGDYLSIVRQQALGVPVIQMLHESPESFFDLVNSRRKIEQINTCPHLQVLQHSFIPEIQKVYHRTIHVIPNTVPQVEETDLADLAMEKPQKTITMISRLHPGKQQDMLIQAFGLLAKDYSEWKVEIYGPLSERGYPRKLKETISSLGLTGQVELMGATSRPLEVLRNADIFAFPSNYSEGWGLALTEAMAVGLPCVGLKRTPSVNELIVDGVNGFLTDNTPEDFAAKLKVLMDDHNLRAAMGRTGHEMMKQYAPEKVWDQWEKLLFEISGT